MEGTATEAQKNVVIVNRGLCHPGDLSGETDRRMYRPGTGITGSGKARGDFKEICRTKRIEKLSPIKET